VDISAALETQRLRLLRLLAGLVCIVQFVSLAPLVSMLPVKIRAYVSAVLDRAEAAVNCLVIATASIRYGYRVPAPTNDIPSPMDVAKLSECHTTTENLLHRIRVLRTVLENLPRYAKRLMKRLEPAPQDVHFVDPMGDAESLRGKFAVFRSRRGALLPLCIEAGGKGMFSHKLS